MSVLIKIKFAALKLIYCIKYTDLRAQLVKFIVRVLSFTF